MSNKETQGKSNSNRFAALFFSVILVGALLYIGGCGGGEDPPAAAPPAASISLSLSQSRLSGVAPLSVFFDATASNTVPAITTAFHDLEYRWDFGDTFSGSWAQGSRSGASSRNQATGPVAAHVYETPGVYTVSLTIVGANGLSATNSSVQVTVEDPNVVFAGNKTLCVSSSGTFNLGAPNECPLGADTLTSSDFKAAIEQTPRTSKRILFRRGETFAAASSASLTNTGAGIIGAFGAAGAKPRVTSPSNDAAIHLSSAATPSFADWRIIDLDIDGENQPVVGGFGPIGISAAGGFNQLTLLRLSIRNVHQGVQLSDGQLNVLNSVVPLSVPLWDQVSIIDSIISNIDNGVPTSGGIGVYLSATRFAFLGNLIDIQGGGEHGMRNPNLRKAVISNNTFANAPPSKLVLTVRGPDFVGANAYPPGTYTEMLEVSDNKFLGGNHDITVSNGTASPLIDQRQRNEIWERNWFVSGPGTQFAIAFNGTYSTTLRNNIFDLTGNPTAALAHTGIRLVSDPVVTPSPADDTFWIYNNTFYSGDVDNDFRAVWLALPGTMRNIIIKNNLAYSPFDGNHEMIFDQSAGAAFPANNLPSNNSSNAQVAGSAPNWSLPISTASPLGFSLTGPSYISASPTVPVFSDFLRNSRPSGTAADIGAFEF